MTIKNKQTIYYIGLYILLVMIAIMTFMTIPIGNFQRNNALVLFTFFLNGTLWLLLIVAEVGGRSYSFMLMQWLFCLLFFFYAPMVQYGYDQFPWVAGRSDEVLITANFLLLFWTIAVFAGSKVRLWKHDNCKSKESSIFVACWENIEKFVPILTVLSALIFLYRVVTVGPQNLLARATSSGEGVSENSSLNMLVGHTMQAVSYFAAVVSLANRKHFPHRLSDRFFAIVNSIFMLISYFPTGLSRYAMAAIYGGMLLTFSNKLKRGRTFILLFLAAFLVVLPFLNAFRNTAFNEVDILVAIQNVLSNLNDAWLAGDYDAYTMLTLAIEYVASKGITWGRQLLGVLLLWVPRSIWPTKPIGSGHMLATNLGWSFTNLSCPLPAEMFLNFGWAGIFLCGFLVGKLLSNIDKAYWKSVSLTGTRPRRLDCIYHCAVFFFFFMCRGDLLSSTAYLMAYLVIWLCVALPGNVKQ